MECSQILFSVHALWRMFEREIHENEVLAAIRGGEMIAEFPDDTPSPSFLMLHYQEGQPLHVVAAKDEATGACLVVTVYRPDPGRWTPDFRNRRNQ